MTVERPVSLLESEPTQPRAQARRSLRPLLTRLHFYAAIFVAPFILVAAVSGMLYAASPQLEKLVYHDELYNDSTGEALPVADQIAAARSAEPELPLLAVRPGLEDGMNTRVLFDNGRTEDSRRLAVFVDPATGDVDGTLTVYGSSGSLPFRTWIDELHRGLHLGDPGRIYSELAASWLWVIGLAGLVLWWTGPRRRRKLRPGGDGERGTRRRLLSWHGALGTWVVVGMLGLSATGLTWSQYAGANVTELREAMDWTTPAVTTQLESDGGPPSGHAGHEGHGSADQGSAQAPADGYDTALRAAQAEGLADPLEITGPVGGSGSFVVQEMGAHWPTQADAVSVDPATGDVADVVRFADYPLPAKLATWGIDLHMGLLFGVWNQLAMIALGATLVTMIVWGYRMWWLRRPTRGHRLRIGRAPRRGGWRSAPPLAVAALVVVGATVGWFIPLLGISLLAFLLLDAAVGLYAGRRTRTGAGAR